MKRVLAAGSDGFIGQLVKAMLRRRIVVEDSRVLVLGLTFKENCPDLRNTRVIDVARELRDFGVGVDCHDPWADPTHALCEYNIDLLKEPEGGAYNAGVLAVAHDQYREMGADALRAYGKDACVLYDLKSMFSTGQADLRL